MRSLYVLLALCIVFAMFITARPSCVPPPVDLPTAGAPDPFTIALGILFVIGLVARYHASKRDPRTEQQRRTLRRAANDIPIHGNHRRPDPDPALPFKPFKVTKAQLRFRCVPRSPFSRGGKR